MHNKVLFLKMVVMAFCLSLAVLLCSCGGPTEAGDGSTAPTWQEQYDLGLRLLSEGKYQEAIIAFTAAIEIDPKQVPAYIGRGDAYVMSGDTEENLTSARTDYETAIALGQTDAEVYQKAAEVCIALGDIDAAVDLLEQGIGVTGDKKLQDALDKLAGVVAPEELFQGSEEWIALEDFWAQLSWYRGYNCETATVPTMINEWSQPMNALEKMLTLPTCYCYNDALYPGEAMEVIWFGPDPLGKWESYGKVNADKIEWILKNIFNSSRTDIEKMKEPILSGQDEDIYYLDGYYYFFVGGIGGGFWAEAMSVEQRGMRYYVEYGLYDMYENMNDENIFQRRYAMLSRKEIDGKQYWTLYYDQEADEYAGQEIDSSTDFAVEDGVLVKYTGSNSSVIIPETVSSIGDSAFAGCNNLTSVTIPDTVTSIGFAAFSGCTSLTSLMIPNSVTSIGGMAFYNSGLIDITIPNSITGISSEAFSRCVNLTSITIPRSVKFVDRRAFEECYSLSNVYYDGSEVDWSQINISGYMDLNSDLLNATIHCKIH